jgi:hypothetical protein
MYREKKEYCSEGVVTHHPASGDGLCHALVHPLPEQMGFDGIFVEFLYFFFNQKISPAIKILIC